MLTIDNEVSPQHWSSNGTIRSKFDTIDSAIVPDKTSARKPACLYTYKIYAVYIALKYCNVLCNVVVYVCNVKMLRDFIMLKNKKVTYKDYVSFSKLKFYLGRLKT